MTDDLSEPTEESSHEQGVEIVSDTSEDDEDIRRKPSKMVENNQPVIDPTSKGEGPRDVELSSNRAAAVQAGKRLCPCHCPSWPEQQPSSFSSCLNPGGIAHLGSCLFLHTMHMRGVTSKERASFSVGPLILSAVVALRNPMIFSW